MRVGRLDLASTFFFIAGPCLVEGEDMVNRVAEVVAENASRLRVPAILKGSFKKANRTSGESFVTIGEERALRFLSEAARSVGLPSTTDIHTPEDAQRAAEYVDLLQIPAFLCRQTDLLQAAAATGLPVNIKKGQFAAPEDMMHAVQKVESAGGTAMLTERGTSFGYHNLIVDMRGLVIMRSFGVPVVYDATHSLQLPSSSATSGGQPALVLPLARAAVAVGLDGVFFETHPEPTSALSDAATQLPLEHAAEFMRQCVEVDRSRRAITSDALAQGHEPS